MTFLEAFERFGRDSMAIAQACQISEASAYNLIAAEAASIYVPRDKRKKRRRLSSYTKPSAGVQAGKYKRVAISFTDEQMARISKIAEINGKSFSATTAFLVEACLLRDIRAEHRSGA